MAKFLLKILLFSVLILLSFRYIYYKRANLLVNKFTNHESTYDIVNLGNSHGGNVVYQGINGKSFQRAGNTLYYDLQNYKYIHEYLNDDAVVLIPVSYFSFGLDENRTDYKNPEAFVSEYYFYLPSDFIFDYSLKKNIQVYLNKVKENYDSVIDERFFLVENTNVDSTPISERLENHAIERVKSHKKMANYSDPKKNTDYLSTLVETVKSNGHKPVLLTMPYADNYNEKFSDTWLDEHYFKHINTILKQYDIPYFNYSKDRRISLNDNLFSNSDHLNKKGRSFFSNILFEDLKKNRLLND